MAKIQQYTRQVMPQNINVQASPEDFGAATGRAMEQAGNVAVEVSDRQREAAMRLQTREETIARMRAVDKFNTDTMNEFTRTQTEMDLIDPQTSAQFNQKTRENASKILNSYQGTPEGKARLEEELLNSSSQYIQNMNASALSRQRTFIMSKAGDKISELSAAVAKNPEKIGDAFKQANAYLNDISPTLYPEDEISLTSAAQEQITLSALRTYTDAGRYDDAKAIIDENPYFLNALSPNAQREILTTISGGIAARDKEVREIKSKTNAIRAAADEMGVEITGPQLFSAVTGITNAQTPEGKIAEFEKLSGKPATPSVIAKIGFGVDLPNTSETDFNKEYTPDGKMTPKGIAAKIKQPFEAAAATKTYKDKIDGAITLFKESGNKQALLSAMITFQKALDEGAVVREGDIALQREAQGLSDKISLFVKPGQVIGDELVNEMQATMNDFANKALMSAKSQIEPYIKDAQERGYRALDYGLPTEAYTSVFGNVQSEPKKNTVKKTDLTLEEFLQGGQ